MRVLAIDASTKSSGLALFEDSNLVDYLCITASSSDLIKRIKKITIELDAYLQEHPVDKIILEEVRPDTNITQSLKTHRALMWLQAAINFLVHEKYPQVTIDYTYPSEWRSACGIRNGRGVVRASAKELDIQFVKDTYGITVNDDIADAIGIGHAFVHHLESEINWA